MIIKFIFVLVVASLLTGLLTSCSQTKILVANILAAHKAEHNVYKDIIYNPTTAQKLNIFSPKGADNTSVIVFFYGGSWQEGSREDYSFVAQPLTDAGYTVVIPDYRKSPKNPYPDFMKDGADAVGWVQKNVHQYNANPQNVFLMGHSAGAHIAALLATHPEFLNDKTAIRGVIGLSGPYDFEPEQPDIKTVFAAAKPTKTAMPVTYVNRASPPFLLVWGGKDTVVGKRNINGMKKALKQYNVPFQTFIEPNLDHAGTVAALSVPRQDKTQVLETILAFLKR